MPTPEHVQADRTLKATKATRDAVDANADLAWLMSDKRGRRFMWRLLGGLGIYQQSYTPGDTHASAFREGQRSVGLLLIDRLHQACADRMSEMQKEVKANVRPDSTAGR